MLHGGEHRDKSFERQDKVHEPLYVITTVFNARRWRSRWRLYEEFAEWVACSGGILYTVELAFGDRDFCLTQPDNPRHVQLSSPHELWFKENLINLAFSKLPQDWKYVAWIDADIRLVRPNWVDDTVQALQHWEVLQMFSDALDLNEKYVPFQSHKGFMWCYRNNVPLPDWSKGDNGPPYYEPTPGGKHHWHPGWAWAAKRRAIDALGGLIDHAILGSADTHMAYSLIGLADRSMHPKIHSHYRALVKEWERRSVKRIRYNIGYLDGLLLHYWHGSKVHRRYRDRWKILVDCKFDPYKDLKRDVNGLWQLKIDRPELRDKIRGYFQDRDEDISLAF